jgi:tRNA(adenine34) deaminase
MQAIKNDMNHEYYMQKALDRAQKALNAGEFPVGCVMIYQGDILVAGSRTGTTEGAVNEIDHAEMVALRRLARMKDNIDPSRITLYCTLEPCLMCFGALILSGIRHIVYAYEDMMGGGTTCDLTKLPPLYNRHPVSVMPHVLRSESLELFKTFFANPKNRYWQGSPLSVYTLRQ